MENRTINIVGTVNAAMKKRVAAELASLGDGPIDVRIDSEGGNYTDGMAIYEMLVAHGDVSTHVVGEACSIASVIMLAGKRRTMFPSSRLMIHQASCGTYGNPKELEQTAETLRVHSKVLIELYANHTSATESQLNEWLEHDHWLTAEQSLELGFVDAVCRDVKPIPIEGSEPVILKMTTKPLKPSESPAWLAAKKHIEEHDKEERLRKSDEMVEKFRALEARMSGGYPTRMVAKIAEHSKATERTKKRDRQREAIEATLVRDGYVDPNTKLDKLRNWNVAAELDLISIRK